MPSNAIAFSHYAEFQGFSLQYVPNIRIVVWLWWINVVHLKEIEKEQI